jgi:hypothetical protein
MADVEARQQVSHSLWHECRCCVAHAALAVECQVQSRVDAPAAVATACCVERDAACLQTSFPVDAPPLPVGSVRPTLQTARSLRSASHESLGLLVGWHRGVNDQTRFWPAYCWFMRCGCAHTCKVCWARIPQIDRKRGPFTKSAQKEHAHRTRLIGC